VSEAGHKAGIAKHLLMAGSSHIAIRHAGYVTPALEMGRHGLARASLSFSNHVASGPYAAAKGMALTTTMPLITQHLKK